MSEEERVERRRDQQATVALIGSSPDVNAIFQGLVERFLGLPGRIGAFFSWWLSNIWIIAAIGVPAMLAAAPLMDKMYAGDVAVRAHELEMFKLQTDVEIKKLDRTLLGEGAMATLKAIADKLDQQASQTAQISQDVQRLSADVSTLRQGQAATDRRVGSIAASQAQMRERMKGP